MNATRDLIAAALTAADELDELHKEGRNPATFTPSVLREACARAMVQPAAPDMAEVERLLLHFEKRAPWVRHEQRAALLDYVRGIMAGPDEWQPIETAPKDGTSVFLCRAIDADGNPIDWSGDLKTAQVFVQVASWWSDDDGWVVYCSLISEPRLHFEPTHWMPLPESPK